MLSEGAKISLIVGQKDTYAAAFTDRKATRPRCSFTSFTTDWMR